VRRAKDGSVTSRPDRHRHKKGDPDPKFAARLDIIRMPFDVILDATPSWPRSEAFDTEAQNESKRASKLMANMYAAVEKAYPATVAPQEAGPRDLGDPCPDPLPHVRRRHRDVADRRLPQRHPARDPTPTAPTLPRCSTTSSRSSTPAPTPAACRPASTGFKYVNGGIFDERIELPRLGNGLPRAVLDACAVDWSSISPAIFGSMFQSVRDAETRRALGEHYTSEENILKTLNPLFLDELAPSSRPPLPATPVQKKVNGSTNSGTARRHPLHGPRLRLRQLHHRRLPRAASH
jgi:hypothetical protein